MQGGSYERVIFEVKAIKAKATFYCGRLITNLPFRMDVGKFGIWLMKVGRIFQVRYANWNREFRLEVEFHPNQDCSTIHVSEQVTAESILTFGGITHNERKQTPLSRELLKMRGVTEVIFKPYEISIHKARVFAWEEVLPQIEEVILKHLTVKA